MYIHMHEKKTVMGFTVITFEHKILPYMESTLATHTVNANTEVHQLVETDYSLLWIKQFCFFLL